MYPSYFGVRDLDSNGTQTKRILNIPASPAKCSEAAFILATYGVAFQWRTYDLKLLQHYMNGGGKQITLPMDAFDPELGHRKELMLSMFTNFNIQRLDVKALGCEDSVFIGTTTGTAQPLNWISRMISTYTLRASADYTLRKSCSFDFTCLGWIYNCYLDYTYVFQAYDKTDFNAGQQNRFKGSVGPFAYEVYDDLILACGLGIAFDIHGLEVKKGTWLVDCSDFQI
jgi:hypothetical protein